MKIYFVVKEDVPLGLAMVGVAHGAMMAELKWKGLETYEQWKETSFKKVIVRANNAEFLDAAKEHKGFFVQESSLGNSDTVFVAYPGDEEFDVTLRKLPLFNQRIKDSIESLAVTQKEARRQSFHAALDVMIACYNEDCPITQDKLWHSLKRTPHLRESHTKALLDHQQKDREFLEHLRFRAMEYYENIKE